MNHDDHVDLLRDGVQVESGQWADLGCGDGAFTLALADLLGAKSVIHAVDTDQRALARLEKRASSRFPDAHVRTRTADFTDPLELPALDGIVMANALHFYRRKEPIIQSIRGLLKPDGRFILVEYNSDSGNRWVPHPISFERWERLAGECGFSRVEKLGAKPSSFLGEIYSALNRT